MIRLERTATLLAAALLAASVASPAVAKDKVKVAFIGPLTGGVSANGIGGRNSAELAVKLRNADPKAKYEYELMVLDDEGKPNTAVQVATKAGADNAVIAAVAHYCSATAIATVDTFNRLGLPMIVAVVPLVALTVRSRPPGTTKLNVAQSAGGRWRASKRRMRYSPGPSGCS